MHRDLELNVPARATDDLIQTLTKMDGVISLSVRRGESIKPAGDVISAAVLNSDVDEVLSRVVAASAGEPISMSTSSLDSLIDTEQHMHVRGDVDEAVWEEAETAMRRHTRPNLNFVLTSAVGGIIATCGLLASSETTAAVALVAAAIIAPAFEPLARIGLAVTNRAAKTLGRALLAAVLCYGILIATGVLTMLLMRSGSHHFVDQFYANTVLKEVRHPPATNLFLSACGAIAGVVMVSSGRFTQLPGALVALQLLPAAAAVGVAIELGDGTVVAHSLGRLALDIGMVLVAGVAYFTFKHITTHGRRSTPTSSSRVG